MVWAGNASARMAPPAGLLGSRNVDMVVTGTRR
jgi:hypothetical protein